MTDWTGLNAEKVRRLLSDAKGSDEFNVIWPNVMWVANEFWVSQRGLDPDDRSIAWHHLVMSVGNFKRQAGRIGLFETPQLIRSPMTSSGFPLSFRAQIRPGEIEVRRDDETSWEQLTLIHGFEVATASTLLSAIWPGFHFIIDRRDLNAAIGLNLVSAEGRGLDRNSTWDVGIDWSWYRWMREMMLKKADEIHAADETIELLQLERSLYLLDTLVPRNKGNSPPLSWEEYSKRAQSVLEAI